MNIPESLHLCAGANVTGYLQNEALEFTSLAMSDFSSDNTTERKDDHMTAFTIRCGWEQLRMGDW